MASGALEKRLARLEQQVARGTCTCPRHFTGRRLAIVWTKQAAAEAEARFTACRAIHTEPHLTVQMVSFLGHEAWQAVYGARALAVAETL